jgi:hypothetical protein
MKGVKEGRQSNSSHVRDDDTHYRLGRISTASTEIKKDDGNGLCEDSEIT